MQLNTFVLRATTFYALLLLSCTSPMKPSPHKIANTIHTIESITVNGVKQYLMIRSDNIKNPLLLYIHGGPGSSELPQIRHYHKDLEKQYTLVYWEQRGTGKSYTPFLDSTTFNVNQFVADAHAISEYCCNRFNKKKLFLIGHSWGTVIATELAAKYPDLYAAYIGIGQIVDVRKGEEIGYRFALTAAQQAGNKKALQELTAINTPRYLTIKDNAQWFKQLKIQRKWVTYYGGAFYKQRDYSVVTNLFLKSKDYSFTDLIRFGLGSITSLKLMWPEIMQINFLHTITQFAIPVYFIQGKFDYNCPTELVEKYYDKIHAPKKQLFIFEQSAHHPNFTEAAKFTAILHTIVTDATHTAAHDNDAAFHP